MPRLEEDIAAVVDRFGYRNVGLVWALGMHGWDTAETRDSFLDAAKQWLTGAIQPGGALSMAGTFPAPVQPPSTLRKAPWGPSGVDPLVANSAPTPNDMPMHGEYGYAPDPMTGTPRKFYSNQQGVVQGA